MFLSRLEPAHATAAVVGTAVAAPVAGADAPRPATGPRIAQLDVLRAAAVFLVLGRHFTTSGPWHRAGWAGVDLFFVLSGFLVAGLLFTEHRRRGAIDVTRFLVRRAWKIYPSFWALVAATAVVTWARAEHHRPAAWLVELTFLQNYGPSVWMHTWSLAVEEHFYLAIALLLPLLARRGGPDPFRRLPVYGIALLVGVLALRVLTVLYLPERYKLDVYGTHLRADSLAAGVLLAYLYHYRCAALERFVVAHRGVLLTLAALGLLPCTVFDFMHPYTRTLGYTVVYLSFAAVLAVVLLDPGLGRALTAGPAALAARLGQHSYNLYLWHIAVAVWLVEPLVGRGAGAGLVVLDIAGAVGAGVLATWLVERPLLALRDRWFPRRAAVSAAPGEEPFPTC